MCLLLTAGAAMAQKKFTYGPKVGVDLTHFWGSGTKFYNSNNVQLNYQVGVFAEYRASDHFAIAPEVVFASQGGIVKQHGIPTGIYKDIYTTNYINVPLMLKFYVTKAVSIDFGPQVGFNVYSKTRGKWEDTKDVLVHRWVLMFIVKHEVSGKIQKTNTTSTIGRSTPTPLTLGLDLVLLTILPAMSLCKPDILWGLLRFSRMKIQ